MRVLGCAAVAACALQLNTAGAQNYPTRTIRIITPYAPGVPYKGGGQALTDTLAGHVAMFFSSMPSAMPHVAAGKFRAIAVSTARRSPAAPNVPTVAESGVPNFDILTWNGLFAPAATPRDIVAKLNGEVLRGLRMPDVKERLTREGAEVLPLTPEQFRSFVQLEIAKFSKIIKESGARPD